MSELIGAWEAQFWTDPDEQQFSIIVDYYLPLDGQHRIITISGVTSEFTNAWYGQFGTAQETKARVKQCSMALQKIPGYLQRGISQSVRNKINEASKLSPDVPPGNIHPLSPLHWNSPPADEPKDSEPKLTGKIQELYMAWRETRAAASSLPMEPAAFAAGYWKGFDAAIEYAVIKTNLEAKNTEPEPVKRSSRVKRTGTELELYEPEDMDGPADSHNGFTPA